jgi:hypothetical protein
VAKKKFAIWEGPDRLELALSLVDRQSPFIPGRTVRFRGQLVDHLDSDEMAHCLITELKAQPEGVDEWSFEGFWGAGDVTWRDVKIKGTYNSQTGKGEFVLVK